MNNDQLHGINRRQFLIAGLCAGGAAIAGIGLRVLSKSGTRDSTVVFRNPAYNLRRDASSLVLLCQTRQGKSIAYRMDEPAALFWEQVPTAEAYSRDGKEITVDAVLDAIAPKFGDRNRSEWQKDARHFAQEALQQGVLLTNGAKVKISYTPPIKSA